MSICICTGNGRERLLMVMGVFKMSRSELNMSGSGSERAENEYE